MSSSYKEKYFMLFSEISMFLWYPGQLDCGKRGPEFL